MAKALPRFVGTILLVVVTASSSCSCTDRTPFTKWMYTEWSKGPYVLPGSRIAELQLGEDALRDLQSDAFERGIEVPDLLATASTALDAEWPDRSLRIHSFVALAMEPTPQGLWVIACALMNGIS